jgi:hypothetical protein
MDPDCAATGDGQEQLPEHATVAVVSAPPSYRPAMQAACASAGNEVMATETASHAAIARRGHANLFAPAPPTGELMPRPAATPAADMPTLLRTQDKAREMCLFVYS